MKLHQTQSYGVSLAIYDHTVLPAIRHKWTYPALTPARQAGVQFTHSGEMEGWVDLGDRWRTEMIYPHSDGQTHARPGVDLATCWSQVRRPNHYTTKPSIFVWER